MARGEQAIVNQLCEIRNLLKAAEDRTIDVFFVTLPESGGTRTFYTGITRINFDAGTIINPDGSVEQITRRLGDQQGKDALHSISIYPENASIIFALDGSGKQTVQQQFLFQLPYVTYTKIQIECTENTEINLFACTNPQATLGNYSNSSEIYDESDDWGVTKSIGLAELAARLGSCQRFDNRGKLLLADNFKDAVLSWNTTLSSNVTVNLDTEFTETGDKSIKFSIPSGSSLSGSLWKKMYHPQTGIYGIEMTWSASIATFSSLKFGLIVYDGTYKWNYYIDLYGIHRTFFMREEGYGNRGVGSMTREFSDNTFWHKWKIVADTDNGKILRVLVDGVEFNPTAYDVERTDDSSDPYIYPFVTFKHSNAIFVGCVDNIILTHME